MKDSKNFSGFDQYQMDAHDFASYGTDLMYPYLGLAEEAGEVLGKAAKFLRHTKGLSPHCSFRHALKSEIGEYREAVKKELGDVLWMVAEIATLNQLDLGDIAKGNLDKLADRRDRGVIDGSGDNR